MGKLSQSPESSLLSLLRPVDSRWVHRSHQDSKTTGSTSCVIWSVKHLGDFEREEALFTSVRLEDLKGQAPCFSLNVSGVEDVEFTDTDGDVIMFRRVEPSGEEGQQRTRVEELVNGNRAVFPVTTIGWAPQQRRLSDGTGFMCIPKPASDGSWWSRGNARKADPADKIIDDLRSLIQGTDVQWVDGDAPLATVVFQGQRLTRMSYSDLRQVDRAYDHGWVCDACTTTSQAEWIYHGAVAEDNPLQINAFDLCDRCASEIPAAEQRYKQRVQASADGQAGAVQIAGRTLTRFRNPQTGAVDLRCEAGHPLQRFVIPQHGFGCDGCQALLPVGAEMAGCRACDYDLCGTCYGNCTRGWQ